jgi:hypothetical protein
MLQQITKQQYEMKALTGNQAKVQSKTSECYATIIKKTQLRNIPIPYLQTRTKVMK